MKILIVDDMPDTAEPLVKLLELNGHEVDYAKDAFTADQYMGLDCEGPYDLIISDWDLKSLDGRNGDYVLTIAKNSQPDAYRILYSGLDRGKEAEELEAEFFSKGGLEAMLDRIDELAEG